MPIPQPTDEETQDDFISRCMSNEVMKREYEDNEQRLAVCFSAWRRRKKEQVEKLTEKRGKVSKFTD